LYDEDIEKIEKDPLQTPLDDKDRATVKFVMKTIESLDTVEKEDVDRLHELGWTDGDILGLIIVLHGDNHTAVSIADHGGIAFRTGIGRDLTSGVPWPGHPVAVGLP
jgi:hypothetical protein